MPLDRNNTSAQEAFNRLIRRHVQLNMRKGDLIEELDKFQANPNKLYEAEWISSAHEEIIDIPRRFALNGVEGPLPPDEFGVNYLVQGYYAADVTQTPIKPLDSVVEIETFDGTVMEMVEVFPNDSTTKQLWRYERTSDGMMLTRQIVDKQDFTDVQDQTVEQFDVWPFVAVKLNHDIKSFYSGVFASLLRLEDVARHIAKDNDRHSKNPLAIEDYKGSQAELEEKFSMKDTKEVIGVKGSVKRLSNTDNTRAIEREFDRIREGVFRTKGLPRNFDEINISGESRKVAIRDLISLAKQIRQAYRDAVEQMDAIRDEDSDVKMPKLLPSTSTEREKTIAEMQAIADLEDQIGTQILTPAEKAAQIRRTQGLAGDIP